MSLYINYYYLSLENTRQKRFEDLVQIIASNRKVQQNSTYTIILIN
jgi:hypothetical protein